MKRNVCVQMTSCFVRTVQSVSSIALFSCCSAVTCWQRQKII